MNHQATNNLGQPIGKALAEWLPCSTAHQTTMDGYYCSVTPLIPELHAYQLYQAFAEDLSGKNWTYMPYGPFCDELEFREWLVEACSAEDPFFYAIIDNQTAKAVGMASYLRITPSVGVIEVGHIHFSPQLQKTPLATQAMFLMMQHAFDQLGYRRYEWKCDALNQSSKSAAKRLGFSYEGTFRQATIYKGRNRDSAWFSVLDSEWPALKAAFIEWLQVKNFDAQGVQIKSLHAFLDKLAVARAL